MQAPGASDEDLEGGFKYGGWTAPFFEEADAEAGKFMERWMESTDILLGETTFRLFAGYWPKHADMWPGIIDVTKYVVSDTMTQADVDALGWKNSVLLTSVDDVKKLKDSEGGPLKVHGSSKLAQSLFAEGLVDQLCLMTFPIVLGTGKRLFADGAMASSFKMTDSLVTKNGVIFGYYERAGEVKTGTVGA